MGLDFGLQKSTPLSEFGLSNLLTPTRTSIMELCRSFRGLFESFAPVFSAPCFSLWTTLMTGWVLSHRHRYVSDLIVSSDATRRGDWSAYYRFFNRYKWSLDALCCQVARLVVAVLVPADAVMTIAVDDTLCRKRGLGLFGAGMHYDPLLSSKKKKLVSWGHDWVVLCVVVHGMWWAPAGVFALPIGFRLYVNKQGLTKGQQKDKRRSRKSSKSKKSSAMTPAEARAAGHKTRPELGVELILLFARWFPERQIVVVGDSLYGGKSVVGHLPENVDLISRPVPKAALYKPAPKPVGKPGKGAPRKKGERLPSIGEWADDPRAPWTTLTMNQYGLRTTLRWKRQEALYYGVGKDRLMSLIVVEDVTGNRGREMFFCTNTNWSLHFILATFARRWSIEVTFENLKQFMGFSDAANWKEKAVRRTAPMAGVLCSLIVVWFHQTGHRHVEFPHRPWYPKKTWPSFGDMLTTVRRLTFEEKLAGCEGDRAAEKSVYRQLTYFLSLAG